MGEGNSHEKQFAAYGPGLPLAGGWKRHMTEEAGVEYQFWTTDNDGRELLVGVATNGADAGILWDGIIRARAFVEWREARNGEYKGRLVRGWDGDAAPAGRLYHPERDRA